jgi:hypothetical protein
MKFRSSQAIAVLSSLACLAAAVLWIDSNTAADVLGVCLGTPASSKCTYCQVSFRDNEVSVDLLTAESAQVRDYEKVFKHHFGPFFCSRWTGIDRIFAKLYDIDLMCSRPAFGAPWTTRRLGFDFIQFQSSASIDLKSIFLPIWLLVALFASAPLLTFVRIVRRRERVITGRCPHCSYDLRATPDRCPECGTAPQKRRVLTTDGTG